MPGRASERAGLIAADAAERPAKGVLMSVFGRRNALRLGGVSLCLGSVVALGAIAACSRASAPTAVGEHAKPTAVNTMDDPSGFGVAPSEADNKEGGRGTRAKGEEGALGANGPRGGARRPGRLMEGLTEKKDFDPAPPAATATAAASAWAGARVAGPQPVAMAITAEAPLRARLDPNARYATTYRPGGATLAAFDAAVARGALPAAYRDLVADFGGRYAPAMDPPHDKALSFRVETERASVPPTGGFLNLRVAMRSASESPGRSPLSVHLVLDVSGSMQGTPMENAKKAAQTLVDRLEPSDVVSITTFSSDANVIVPSGAVGPRRTLIKTRIESIQAEGGTNISAGLDLGYGEAKRAPGTEGSTRIVMLLSDGMANAGDTNPDGIARRSALALEDAVQTSTFGLGDSFDAAVMSKIADRGAGGYYYLKDSSQIAGALSTELDARLQPVAQAVEVRVRLKPDVSPVRVYGSRELGAREAMAVRAQEVAVDKNVAKHAGIAQDRKDDAEGGMRFFMPAFARADRHAMLVELELPAGVGERAIGSVEIRYKDLLRKKNVTEEIPLRVGYAGSDAESAKTINASVVATTQAFSAGDAILRASDFAAGGARDRAATMLRERADLLQRAATSLSEPRLGEDAARLTRLASIVTGETAIDPVPLAVLLRGSAYGYLK